MSASREKKQRRGQGAATQAASGKGKTVAYAVLAVVIVIAVAALLIWNSGFFQGRSTAISVDGHNYTPAQVEFYYQQAYTTEVNNAVYYGTSQFNYQLDPKEQTYSTDSETGEITTYHDYFMDQAKESLVQLTALLEAAKAEGFTLSAESKASIEESYADLDQYWASRNYSSRAAYLRGVYGPYMTFGRYKQCVEDAQLVYDYQISKGEAFTYEDADLQAYYNENTDRLDTVGYAYLFYRGEAATTTDDDGNTVEPTEEETKTAMAAAKEKADAALAAWQGGSTFQQVSESYEPSTSSESATALGSNLSPTYSEWLLAEGRAANDTTVIEASNGYYVVRFLSRTLVQEPTVNIRHILIKAETPADDPATEDVDESQNAPSEEQMAAAKAEAERIYTEWQNGEATEESFAALANQYSDDPGSNTNGGLYTRSANGSFVPAFNDWCFAEGRKAGDTGLVENTNSGQYGWHVLYFQGQDLPVWKITAENALRSEDTQEWLDGLLEGLEATEEAGMKYLA